MSDNLEIIEPFDESKTCFYVETKAGYIKGHTLTEVLTVWNEWWSYCCDPKYDAISVGRKG